VLEPFSLPFFQRGLLEVLLLAVLAGALGTWIVLRGLAFLAHAVGTATFPGLVLAEGLGFAAVLGALGAALLTAALVGGAARRRDVGADSLTALALAGALALGIVLASDVFASPGSVDRLLFGSLLTIDGGDLALAAGVALAAVAASILAGSRWLADGFAGVGEHRPSSRAADTALVVLIAVAAVAALAATGALLATAILVVPAATTRLFADRVPLWQFSTAALAAAEGVLGMWLAYQLNVPPGAAIAVLAGVVFALAAVARVLARRRPRVLPAAAAALVLGALGLAGCGGDDSGGSAGEEGQVRVVATTTQVADIARQVGGEAVQVDQILQPNSEVHDYEPRPDDVAAVAKADVVLTSGLELDEWAEDLIKDSGSSAKVVELGRDLPVSHEVGEGGHDDGEEKHSDEEKHADEEDHGHSGTDPHWWHDPENVAAAATTAETALIAADPAVREEVTANAEAFRARAGEVDRAVRACIEQIPQDRRRIVTDHDAFVYFTERYGVESVGAVIPSLSSQGQPSAGELAELEETIEREGVKAVFPESSLNPKLAERLAQDTGVTSDFQLYGDTLGAQDEPAGTVLGALAANATAMVQGMSGGTETCEIEA
jgi:ABC-type Zn uptake system ZnuABC Zn-binding protein ZnuA/ABC-type Mn2+/Zn2+ transport system permease subunit